MKQKINKFEQKLINIHKDLSMFLNISVSHDCSFNNNALLKIEDCGFKNAFVKACKNDGFNYLGDLAVQKISSLKRIPGVGESTIIHLIDLLYEKGLKPHMDKDSWELFKEIKLFGMK